VYYTDEYLDTKPGYVVNAGGPVYALDWCPHDDTERPSPVEYLALGAYSQSRALIPPAAPALVGQNPGLIQIWALDATQASDFGRRTSEAKGPPMRLALGICIDVGEAWRLQWRPLQAGHTASGGLGHLAGVFGDGSLCIFDVPDPAQIQDATSTPFGTFGHRLFALLAELGKSTWSRSCDSPYPTLH
jgi:transcription factor C subunit 6